MDLNTRMKWDGSMRIITAIGMVVTLVTMIAVFAAAIAVFRLPVEEEEAEAEAIEEMLEEIWVITDVETAIAKERVSHVLLVVTMH